MVTRKKIWHKIISSDLWSNTKADTWCYSNQQLSIEHSQEKI